MITLELTAEELDLLGDLLEHCGKELALELAHTDSQEFKRILKHRREVLESLGAKLRAAPAPA